MEMDLPKRSLELWATDGAFFSLPILRSIISLIFLEVAGTELAVWDRSLWQAVNDCRETWWPVDTTFTSLGHFFVGRCIRRVTNKCPGVNGSYRASRSFRRTLNGGRVFSIIPERTIGDRHDDWVPCLNVRSGNWYLGKFIMPILLRRPLRDFGTAATSCLLDRPTVHTGIKAERKASNSGKVRFRSAGSWNLPVEKSSRMCV